MKLLVTIAILAAVIVALCCVAAADFVSAASSPLSGMKRNIKNNKHTFPDGSSVRFSNNKNINSNVKAGPHLRTKWMFRVTNTSNTLMEVQFSDSGKDVFIVESNAKHSYGYLSRVNGDTGKPYWTVDLAQAIGCSSQYGPTVELFQSVNNLGMVVCDRVFGAFDLTTGKKVWSRQYQSHSWGAFRSILSADRKSYFYNQQDASNDITFVSVDIATGDINFDVPIYDGARYIQLSNSRNGILQYLTDQAPGAFLALDEKAGSFLWKIITDTFRYWTFDSFNAIAMNMGSQSSWSFFDATSGKLLRNYTLPASANGVAGIANVAALPGCVLAVGAAEASLVNITDSGRVLWTYTSTSAMTDTPTVIGARAFIKVPGLQGVGKLVVLDLSSGKAIGSVPYACKMNSFNFTECVYPQGYYYDAPIAAAIDAQYTASLAYSTAAGNGYALPALVQTLTGQVDVDPSLQFATPPRIITSSQPVGATPKTVLYALDTAVVAVELKAQ